MPDQPEEREFDRIKRRIDAASMSFKQNEAKIIRASNETLKWLQRNNRFYQQDGASQQGRWWIELPLTDNPVLADIRLFAFRCHLYENGVRCIINMLMEEDVIKYTNDINKHIQFAVDYPAMGLHHELVGYKAGKTNNALYLSDVTRRFGLANPVKLRDSRLAPMAELGMWECHADSTRHSIEIGQVAYHFHLKVFMALISTFDPATGTF